MTATYRRRGALCAAIGCAACAALLVRRADAPDPATRLVQSERIGDAVRAYAVPGASRVDGAPRLDEMPSGGRDTRAALIVALGDADANVRMDAVSELGLSSDARAESLLVITALQDPAPQVRIEALYALESLDVESHAYVFLHALHDPDEDVRKTAFGALEELGSEPPDDAE